MSPLDYIKGLYYDHWTGCYDGESEYYDMLDEQEEEEKRLLAWLYFLV